MLLTAYSPVPILTSSSIQLFSWKYEDNNNNEIVNKNGKWVVIREGKERT
jgi:hypothetical protein